MRRERGRQQLLWNAEREGEAAVIVECGERGGGRERV